MKELTEKQLAYATHRAEGVNKRQSALAAGYSQAGAGSQADQLERLPHVKAAIARIKREKRRGNVSSDEQIKSIMGQPAGVGRKPKDEPRMKAKYDSPLDLLIHTYNNPLMPDSTRLRAAEQALPYMHARVAEKGKKETAKDRAHEVAASGGSKAQKAGKKSPFAPKAPPSLTLVGGGKS